MLRSVPIKPVSIPIKQASRLLTAKIPLESAKFKKERSTKTAGIKSKELTKYNRSNRKLIRIFPPIAAAIFAATFRKESRSLSFRNRPYPMTIANA